MHSLPIDALFSEFEATIAKYNLVVEAETGSGKSTKLPLWASKHGRVLVIEPRRIACTSLAEYTASQRLERVGQSIGYAIKLDVQFSEDSDIVFVTPGVALRWFSENKLADFDIVMIDEFHERRWDTDLLVALLKEANRHRLIVTSATLEGHRLAEYVNATRLQSQGRLFDVDYIYRTSESQQLPDIRMLENRIVDEVKKQLIASPGDILVFLPGRKEITQCAQMLQSIAGCVVVKLHASVSDKERKLALSAQPLRVHDSENSGDSESSDVHLKKVVLATNVAETSLTIPNISTVIDSGLERRTIQRNGRTTLSLKSISKASSKQRAGRAGRVMDGLCIRLYGEHAALESMTPPELQREELVEPMLAVASCGYSLDQLSFLDDLPSKSMASATEKLRLMQAIDSEGNITPHGTILSPLPIDVLYADLVTRMPSRALKEVMVDLAAALSVPAAIYQIKPHQDDDQPIEKQEPHHCDGEILINLVRGRTFDSIQVEQEALKEAKGLSKQMREAFELPQLDVASRYDRHLFLTSIAQLHPELVFVRREKRRQALANGEMEVAVGRHSRFSDKAEAAIVMDTHSIPGRGVKQTLNLATVMLPVPLSLLIELELGDWVQGETTVVKSGEQSSGKNQILTEMELRYAGRLLTTRQVMPEGELLLRPIVDAVNRNEWLIGLADERRMEINLWKLYVELGLDAQHSTHGEINFEQWFIDQLTELEIQDVEELSIFDNSDFTFEGIPYWEFDDFAHQYPQSITLADLQLTVEYYVSKKLIHVIYQRGSRKGDPKRWELPTWKGWRIQYKKASRVVDVR